MTTEDNNVISSNQYGPGIVSKLHFKEQQISLLKEELMKTRGTCPGVSVNAPEIE